MHSSPTKPEALSGYVDGLFERDVIGTLSAYVAIRCLSPDFDPDWAANGEIGRAARMLADWGRARQIPGISVEIVEHEGLTPVIVADIPATPGEETRPASLLYGHFDKQPPLGSWREGLDPFVAVRDGDRLYGRGTADDGYAIFAALAAIEALAATGTPHGRCVVLVESSEESGSSDLTSYLDEVGERIGKPGPGLVVCLDSGAATYDRLWNTTSLRGSFVATLGVEVLTQGIHSGLAGGVVPSSFRILRQLLSRVEDPATGEILVPEFRAEIPAAALAAAEAVTAELGEAAVGEFPAVPTLELSGDSPADRLIRRTWMPAVAFTGIDGVPSVKDGGNVLRPFTTGKLCFRLPPSVEPLRAAEALVHVLTSDPPQGARVEVEISSTSPGFEAPPQAEWLARAVEESSELFFGKGAGQIGEGGTIPFLTYLLERFPRSQFLVTGVLGPSSNAHGPNEMLHLGAARHVTACVAHVLAAVPPA